jgi:hypothetical protein
MSSTAERFREHPDAISLLASLETARTVITSVTDEEGKILIGRGLFWLTDRAGLEALSSQALAHAKTAAAEPKKKCKPLSRRAAAAD